MGNFVNVSKEGQCDYIALTEKPFEKVLAIEKKISLHRFSFVKKYRSSQVFYDTNTNLLEKAGIVLSKINTPDKTYFMVERQSFLPKTFSRRNEQVFIHEVGARDKVSDHAFYLVDGIKSLFITQFTIDLENVLKNITPKIILTYDILKYDVLSGGGFKAILLFKDVKIKNLETKRKFSTKLLNVSLDCPDTYMTAFKYFNQQIDKYCKEFLHFDETLYDYAHRVTKAIPQKKLTKEEKLKFKNKNKIIEENIE